MSVPHPPPYNPPAQAQDPDDRDHEKPNETSLWSYIQAFIIFAVLAIVITELVLSVQNRRLAHHAIGLATTANETAENANVPVSLTYRTCLKRANNRFLRPHNSAQQ